MAVKDQAAPPNLNDPARFRVNVKLVLARVVVRDANGHVVGNLHKEDFELFDNGKLQVISNFDVEHSAAPTAVAGVASKGTTPVDALPSADKPLTFPARYVAYLFDDLHLSVQDIAMVRDAAHRRLDALRPTDRVAIFSTSRRTTQDFTDDRALLHKTLNELGARPISGSETNSCPQISLYQADLIVNRHDPEALQTAINDYTNCAFSRTVAATTQSMIEATASMVLTIGEQESRNAFDVVQETVHRMAAMPGQRNLVLVSPGFLTPDLEYEFDNVVDRALRAQVVINTLDARGLYVTIAGGDASEQGQMDVPPNVRGVTPPPGTGFTAIAHPLLETRAASAQADILAVLANGTGGTFFHNNNDMDEGLRRLAEPPEYDYILGFAPQNLKTDGKFHTLKVRLGGKTQYQVQSRNGYFAARHAPDPAEEAKREMEDELLSSEELHDLPIALHTQFFKASDESAKLTVMARVDVKRLSYKQADGRSQNDLTVLTGVFDRNGNILQSSQKLVQMHWKPETLQGKLASGITLKTDFDVKPGRYLVRIVARDTEQRLMSAENSEIDIP